MSSPIDSSTTTLGHTVYDNLVSTSNLDRFADAQRASGDRMSNYEDQYADAASQQDTPEAVSKWATDHGYGAVKNQSALLTMIDSKMNQASQTFLGLQKMRERMNDTMMEIIRAIGK